jgi:3-methyladenine DNA glycosylase AlkD
MSARRPLIQALRRELERHADPAKAPAMQAYMKSSMSYRGVPTPESRRIQRQVFAAHPLPDFKSWRDTALALWRDARFREERYGAIGLTGYPAYERFRTLAALPMYEELIVTGAWWDYVDGIASDRLGPLLRRYPAAMGRRMRQWSRCENLWKRRAAILCQLTFKADTDLELLYDCIRPNLVDREFFMRKAIGWALRQYAWTDPAEIVRFVREHAEQLSPLSRREALKNVGRTARATAAAAPSPARPSRGRSAPRGGRSSRPGAGAGRRRSARRRG